MYEVEVVHSLDAKTQAVLGGMVLKVAHIDVTEMTLRAVLVGFVYKIAAASSLVCSVVMTIENFPSVGVDSDAVHPEILRADPI